MKQLDLSIIIVSWNTREILRKCLGSLCNHTRNISFETIVVDNGSSDGSAETVEKEFPQVKLIRNQENLGFARANNIGIKAIAGRYLCLMNSDIFVLNGCLMNLITFMDQNLNVGMSGPRLLNRDHIFQPSCRYFPSIWNNLCHAFAINRLFPKSAFFSDSLMEHWEHDTVQSVDVLPGCLWMVRREALNQVGLLDERFFIYGEDVDWCKRFHDHGWDVVFYPDAETIHYHGASSANDPIRFIVEMQKADLQYWKKHHGSIGKAAYMAIILLRHVLRVIARAFQYLIRPSQRKTIAFKLKQSMACIRLVLHL